MKNFYNSKYYPSSCKKPTKKSQISTDTGEYSDDIDEDDTRKKVKIEPKREIGMKIENNVDNSIIYNHKVPQRSDKTLDERFLKSEPSRRKITNLFAL